MGGDAVREMSGQAIAEGFECGLFGAADVGHQRSGLEERRDAAADGGQGRYGCGDEDQVSRTDIVFTDGIKSFVNHAALQRAVEIAAAQIDAGDFFHQPEPFQIQRKRTADEADADKGDLSECSGRVHVFCKAVKRLGGRLKTGTWFQTASILA